MDRLGAERSSTVVYNDNGGRSKRRIPAVTARINKMKDAIEAMKKFDTFFKKVMVNAPMYGDKNKIIQTGIGYDDETPQFAVFFRADTTLEEKDTIVDWLLGRLHKVANTTFSRSLSNEVTFFNGKCGEGEFEDMNVQIMVFDSLGCYMETVDVKVPLEEREEKKYTINNKGEVIEKNIFADENGKMFRIEKKVIPHCSGEAPII